MQVTDIETQKVIYKEENGVYTLKLSSSIGTRHTACRWDQGFSSPKDEAICVCNGELVHS